MDKYTSCKVFGKKYEFYMSTRAVREISSICTDGQFENFDKDLQNKNDADRFEFTSQVCVILNKAAIMRRRFENGEPMGDWDNYEDALSAEMLECLDPVEYVNNVYTTALSALYGGAKTEIEVEDEKKAGKATKKSK